MLYFHFVWWNHPNCGMNMGNSGFRVDIVDGAVTWMLPLSVVTRNHTSFDPCRVSQVSRPLRSTDSGNVHVHFTILDWWQLEKAGEPNQATEKNQSPSLTGSSRRILAVYHTCAINYFYHPPPNLSCWRQLPPIVLADRVIIGYIACRNCIR